MAVVGEQRTTVEAPEDLASALAGAPEASAKWERLSSSHRTEYVSWIEEAKKPETRARRIERALGMIAEGERRQ